MHRYFITTGKISMHFVSSCLNSDISGSRFNAAQSDSKTYRDIFKNVYYFHKTAYLEVESLKEISCIKRALFIIHTEIPKQTKGEG